jgi:HlyD family secretion protein
VLTLMTSDGWRVDTEDLTELDVVRMVPGTPVEVRFDALPELQLAGTVGRVALMGSNRQGDIVYTVEIALAQADPRLRWNMTAVVTLP